jgi:zinc/manganese transport system permease protein
VIALGPFSWLTNMLSHPFMGRAFIAGTVVAVACGVVGYFLVLRAQVFTGDALSHVAFTGALAALAFGIDLRIGLFIATVAVGLGMGLLGSGGRADDVVIGSVFVWMLGLGVLFLSIFTTSKSGAAGSNGAAGVHVLFGSIFGLSAGDVVVVAVVGSCVLGAVLFIDRPLLFASLDAAVAEARGVPVRALGIGFLGIVGLTAAATTEAVGALLLLGLLAAPAAAAQRMTIRPFRGVTLAAALAVTATWIGLVASYEIPKIPPSFAIVSIAVIFHAGSYVIGERDIASTRSENAILIHSHS